ncbi:MAG: Crp/Fnr family transcriptional regulator [Pyrinomonadaceae bacterium]
MDDGNRSLANSFAPLRGFEVRNPSFLNSVVRSEVDPKQNRLLARLPVTELERLRPRLQLVRFDAGQTVYPAEHVIDSIYFPLTAVASRLTVLEDGSTVEAGLIGNDGVIGLSAFMGDGRTRNWTVIDLAGATLRIRAATLNEFLPTLPRLGAALSASYQDLFSQVTRRAVCRSRHTIVEQLCSWLLMVRDRSETSALPLTQESIARRLGSRRAGITVAANALKKAGAIDYSRGRIVITDRAELEGMACECYAAVCENVNCAAIWQQGTGDARMNFREPNAA